MKPSEILKVMDIAKKAREMKRNWNPIFVGPPGIAKSVQVQSWAKANAYRLIDIRTALREAQDLLGFPVVETIEDIKRLTFATPNFWPSGNEKAVIFFDEVNRGNTSVLNAIMQILTDRKIGEFEISPNAIICAAINPEDEHNDVNVMDSALKDRFEFFSVEYDKKEHLEYMRASGYEKVIIDWVESGTWKYRRPEMIRTDVAGDKYLSPRSLEKLDTAMKSGGLDNGDTFEVNLYHETLGTLAGSSFYQFKANEQPVTFADLKNEKTQDAALRRLKELSNPDAYKAGTIAITIRDIVDDGTVEDDLLCAILLALPLDQGPNLLYHLQMKRGDMNSELSKRILANEKVKAHFKQHVDSLSV